MVCGDLELFGKLHSLIDGGLFFAGLRLDLFGAGLDGFFELGVAFLVFVELHVLLGLDEGRDQLTVGLAHI